MSGLETAIRNALERSERSDKEVRARIYQSARQALDAGLRKQGVSDQLVIMQQHKRLEDKILEIENEEIDRLVQSAPAPAEVKPNPSIEMAPEPVVVSPEPNRTTGPALAVETPVHRLGQDALEGSAALGGVTRDDTVRADPAAVPEIATDRQAASAPAMSPAAVSMEDRRSRKARKAEKGKAALDIPAERAAKPRRRRGFFSHLLTWMVTLAVVAVGCWLFYRSGMVQSVMEEAMQAADRAGSAQLSGQGPSALASRGGFSEDWTPIFEPTESTAFTAGAQAQAGIATGTEGEALRIVSATPNAEGDVAIEAPAEILRELAGRSSTLALTIQSAADQPAQLSVRCDFGSLGACQRHRFTATQEKLDALFRVTFDGTPAPSAPGRLILNTGLGGADRPIFVYSVRALPGQ